MGKTSYFIPSMLAVPTVFVLMVFIGLCRIWNGDAGAAK